MIEEAEARLRAAEVLREDGFYGEFDLAKVDAGWIAVREGPRPPGDTTVVVTNDGRAASFPSSLPAGVALHNLSLD